MPISLAESNTLRKSAPEGYSRADQLIALLASRALASLRLAADMSWLV